MRVSLQLWYLEHDSDMQQQMAPPQQTRVHDPHAAAHMQVESYPNWCHGFICRQQHQTNNRSGGSASGKVPVVVRSRGSSYV